MFRKVISQVRNVRITKSKQLYCTNVEDMKLERTLNRVTLLGRVGGNPQQRGSEEHPVVLFSVATHSNYKNMNGDLVQRTDWHKICVFKPNLRETVFTYLQKGQRVLVSGKITYGEFKDEEGTTKTSTSVIADDVIFFQL
ncbi:single-stranded DNA-binding protein, mitochondrial isoform X3 [Frieseomelitta varia]|uniref:single-stranded DNA-binding protein, mitochondrial isoform X3 n=1 Tax=Frieseomelitta varia TaxID=561572 RepID=UPI001CB69CEF|nr:single-stranded DNA-binding protein, mitochondrial isoform X3 [Frieseomelitta varia]